VRLELSVPPDVELYAVSGAPLSISPEGTLVAFVAEGALTLDHEGKETVTYKTGETFSVEPGKVHEGMNKGSVPTRLIATFVFPKDQPMTTQVK
jgi:quercetin dioxygenase-like cupin family protein